MGTHLETRVLRDISDSIAQLLRFEHASVNVQAVYSGNLFVVKSISPQGIPLAVYDWLNDTWVVNTESVVSPRVTRAIKQGVGCGGYRTILVGPTALLTEVIAAGTACLWKVQGFTDNKQNHSNTRMEANR